MNGPRGVVSGVGVATGRVVNGGGRGYAQGAWPRGGSALHAPAPIVPRSSRPQLALPGAFLALLVNHSLISPGSSCPARPSREAVLQGCQSVPAPFKAHTTKGKTSRG